MLVSEKNYRLHLFKERFEAIKEQKNAIYGTQINAKALIDNFDVDFKFVCLIDNSDWNRIISGKMVISLEQAIALGVDNIILGAKTDSAFYIYERIKKECHQNGIRVWDMYGNDMSVIEKRSVESLISLPNQSNSKLREKMLTHDSICVQLDGALFTSVVVETADEAIDFWRGFDEYVEANGIKCRRVSDGVMKINIKRSYITTLERLKDFCKLENREDTFFETLKSLFVKYILETYKVRQQIKEDILLAIASGKKVYIYDDNDNIRLDSETVRLLLEYNGLEDVENVISVGNIMSRYDGLIREILEQVDDNPLFVSTASECSLINLYTYGIEVFRVLSPFEYSQMDSSRYSMVEAEYLKEYSRRKLLGAYLQSACSNCCFFDDERDNSEENKNLLSQISRNRDCDQFSDVSTYVPQIYDEVVIRDNVEQYDKLIFSETSNPTVSIIIPVYNQFGYTYNCLKSILNNTENIDYEVILADDCSTDQISELEKIALNVNVIHNETNLKFLLNCNNAAKQARGKYILFLNNDTQVQARWLDALLQLIEGDDSIGMVGSKLVYPDGRLQEAGGIIWKDGSASNYGRTKDPELPEYNYVKDVDYITGASMMIRKSLWEEIGGFDTRFTPAYCEDSDLAFEVRKAGYRVVYQPLSVVVHFEGISNGKDVSSGLKKYQVENGTKLFQKWNNELEDEHFSAGNNLYVARDRSLKKPCILMIDQSVPQYDKDAGSRTVLAYLKLFIEKGYNVKFLSDLFEYDEKYTTNLQQMGIEVLYGDFYEKNWKKWITENGNRIDYVFLNRPQVSEKYIEHIKAVTNAKIIYYGHDLHFLREWRQYELTQDMRVKNSSDSWKVREFKLMKEADVVYYPSQVEVDEIAKEDKSVNAKAITAYIFSDVRNEKYDIANRNGLLFVGGFGHAPNGDAVEWFCKDIFPQILSQYPDMYINIVGSKTPDAILRLANDNIHVLGYVSDEELADLYTKSRMAVIPLRYGAGIKGKVVEAMSNGLPIVTTAVGAEGITGSEDILRIENEPELFAKAVCELYDNEAVLEGMSRDSYEYIKSEYSAEQAWSIISQDFEK